MISQRRSSFFPFPSDSFIRIFFFLCLIFSWSFLYSAEYGRTTAFRLNLRSGPSTSTKIITTLKKGALLEILEKKEGWWKVRFGRNVGWASSQYIQLLNQQGPVKGKVMARALNVRIGNGTSYKRIFVLYKGESFEVLEEKDGWLKIRFSLNSNSSRTGIGWVMKKYTKTEKPRLPESENEELSLKDKQFLGIFKPTFYWIIYEGDFPSGDHIKKAPVFDVEGKILGFFSRKFVDRLWLEGSGKLKDGRVLNYVKRGRFKVINNAPYGFGYANKPLRPFRSVAVDPKVIPLGSTLYIPAAKGAKLPDGTIHDGIFYAEDTGGAIKGHRIDLFTGFFKGRKVFENHGILSYKPLKVYLLKKKPASSGRGIIRRLPNSGN